jgi:hypothetical protein
MADTESKVRSAITVYFPMFIATLSLVTAIYNGYLNNKFVDLMQGNVGRVAYMQTCKDIIDAYFQVKFRLGVLSARVARDRANGTAAPGMLPEQIDAMNAVNKFAALGTYLANLRDERIREYYTGLSMELEKIVNEAKAAPLDLDKRFGPPDTMFDKLNDDCIKSAHAAPM